MRLRRLLVLAVLLPLAGCGGGGSPAGSSAAHHRTPPAVTTDLPPEVLELADLGVGWVRDLPRTGPVPLVRTTTGDPAPLRRLERGAYRGGYGSRFEGESGAWLYSAAYAYASPQDARAVAAGWGRSLPQNFVQVDRVAVGSPALGAVESVWNLDDRRAGRIHLVQWVHGNIVAVLMAGARTTVAEALAIARKQEARIGGHPDPAPPLTGEAARSPMQILTDAALSTEAATAAHLWMHAGGRTLDVRAGRFGGYATIIRPYGDVRMIRLGDQVWTNADRGVFAHAGNPAAGTRFGGRWVTMSKKDPAYVPTANLTTLPYIAALFRPATGSTAPRPTTLGALHVRGRLVVVVTLVNDNGAGAAVYVPVRGARYPTEVDLRKGGVTDRIHLDEWNDTFVVIAPPHPVRPGAGCHCTI